MFSLVFLLFSQAAFPVAGVFSQLHCGVISNATRDTVYEDANETARMIDRYLDGGSSASSVQFRGVSLDAATVLANRTQLSAADFRMAMLMFRQGYSVRRHPESGRVLPEVMNSLSSEYAGLLNSVFQGIVEANQAAGRTPPASITRGLQQLRQDCGNLATRAAPTYSPGAVESGVIQPMIRQRSADGLSEVARPLCPDETTASLSGNILIEALKNRMQSYSCFYIEKHREMLSAYEAARSAGQLRNVTSTFSRSVGGGPYLSVTETAPETVSQWRNRIATSGGANYSPDELFVAATPGMRTPARNVDYAMTSALIGSLLGIPNFRFTLDDDRNSCYAGFLSVTRNTLERQRDCRSFQSTPEYQEYLTQTATCLAELKNRFCRRQPNRCIGDPDTTVDETVEDREARRRQRAAAVPVPPPLPAPAVVPVESNAETAVVSAAPVERATVRMAAVGGTPDRVPEIESLVYPRVSGTTTRTDSLIPERVLARRGYQEIPVRSCFFGNRDSVRCYDRVEVLRPINAPRGSIMEFRRGNCVGSASYNPATDGDRVVLVRSTGSANPSLPATTSGQQAYALCAVYVQPTLGSRAEFQTSVSRTSALSFGNRDRQQAVRWELDAQSRYVIRNSASIPQADRTRHWCRIIRNYRSFPGGDNNDDRFLDMVTALGGAPTIQVPASASARERTGMQIRSMCPSI